jgi:hypothetical protein
MIRGDSQKVDSGLVRGVPKHSVRPLVDGIVTGVPRKAVPSAATPVEKCHASATPIPHAAFGSGIFGEGAGAAAATRGAAREHKGTTKGEPRKTARKAYEM